MRKILLVMASLLVLGALSSSIEAQNFSFSKRFYFHLGKHDIDESLNNNRQTVDSILITLRDLKQRNATDIRMHITSYASLESSDAFNAKLTFNRTTSLTNYLNKFTLLEGVAFESEDNIFDWQSLIEKTSNSYCPNKAEALDIMRRIPSTPTLDGNLRKDALQKLGNGETYEYMRQHFFPEMRNSKLTITANVPAEVQTQVIVETVEVTREPQYVPADEDEWIFPRKGVFALRTNALYDLLYIPNIGIEAYVTDNISVGVDWMYSWLKNDTRSIYWRVYGGDIRADYWFDTEEMWKGHHVGVYGQMVTYDFEWKGKGYQGPKFSWGGGISYGYTKWLNKRFSLDFGIFCGYLGGKYYKYTPSNNRKDIYYLEETKHRNWIGPTKAEVSLIWKIGNE